MSPKFDLPSDSNLGVRGFGEVGGRGALNYVIIECDDLPPRVEVIQDRRGQSVYYYVRPGVGGILAALMSLLPSSSG